MERVMIMSDSMDIRDQYHYPCRVTHIVDGDTVDVVIDLGFEVRVTERVRASGIDTAEVYGVDRDSAEYERGTEHSAFVKTWFDSTGNAEWPFILHSKEYERGVFGRIVGDIYSRARDGWWTEAVTAEFPSVTELTE